MLFLQNNSLLFLAKYLYSFLFFLLISQGIYTIYSIIISPFPLYFLVLIAFFLIKCKALFDNRLLTQNSQFNEIS